MAKPTAMCPKCDVQKQCPVWSSVRRLLGAWVRERRRQGAGMFGNVDRKSMEEATEGPLEEALKAECDCSCHEEGRTP